MILHGSPNAAEGNVDRIIYKRFFRGDKSYGVFVDVGAAGPDYLSISALFRSLGWRIFGVEPNPEFCDLHKRKSYEIWQYACGDHDEDNVDFQLVHSHGTPYEHGEVTYESFSSLAIKDAYRAMVPDLDTRTIKVDLRRLDTLLQTHAPEIEQIDVLSVDVEGWELEVLRGFSMQRYTPMVVVVENLLDAKEYRSYMSAQGYPLWKRIPPNDVYVRPDRLGSIELFLLSTFGRLLMGKQT